MSEAPALEGALIRKIDDLLKTALGQASLILSGAGASTEEMLRATQAFVPLMCLLRDSLKVRASVPPALSAPADLEGSALSPEEIERQITEPLAKVIPMVRR